MSWETAIICWSAWDNQSVDSHNSVLNGTGVASSPGKVRDSLQAELLLVTNITLTQVFDIAGITRFNIQSQNIQSSN